MFCPTCGALMRLDKQKGKLCCAHCGCEKDLGKQDKKTVTTKATVKEQVVLEGELNVLPTTREAECAKCGNREAYWILRQTRAADEAETRIYECTKCHYRWREY
jgi:DNA-directed RNA polymerase subunit M